MTPPKYTVEGRVNGACERGGCVSGVSDGHRFCSRRCAAIARLCAGWVPHASLTPAVRARGCRLGAMAAATTQRRQRAKLVRARISALLASPVFADLTPTQRAAVTALIAKGYRVGKADGYQRGWHAKEVSRLKRAQKGQAA